MSKEQNDLADFASENNEHPNEYEMTLQEKYKLAETKVHSDYKVKK